MGRGWEIMKGKKYNNNNFKFLKIKKELRFCCILDLNFEVWFLGLGLMGGVR